MRLPTLPRRSHVLKRELEVTPGQSTRALLLGFRRTSVPGARSPWQHRSRSPNFRRSSFYVWHRSCRPSDCAPCVVGLVFVRACAAVQCRSAATTGRSATLVEVSAPPSTRAGAVTRSRRRFDRAVLECLHAPASTACRPSLAAAEARPVVRQQLRTHAVQIAPLSTARTLHALPDHPGAQLHHHRPVVELCMKP